MLSWGDLARLACALLVAAVCGRVFVQLDVPAGWLLGSLFGTAIFRHWVGPLAYTKTLRRGGQLVVGTAVAGLLTPTILNTLGDMIFWLVLAAVATNALCFALSVPAGRWGGLDRRTAALCCLPGGLSEMAALAREVGANDQAVAVFHTLRVTLIVTTIPLLLIWLGFEVLPEAQPSSDTSGSIVFLGLIAAASIPAALAAARVGLVNPWVVMPIALGIVAVLLGLSSGPMPESISIAAQIAIGVALGAQLDRSQFMALPRVFAAGLAVAVTLIAVTLLIGATVVPFLIGVPSGTGVVAMAPGGIAEMIAVSKALDLMPATVAAFGIVRSVLTNTVVSQLVIRLPGPPSLPDDRTS